MDSNSTKGGSTLKHSNVADALIEGFLSSGSREKKTGLSSSISKLLHSLNSFSSEDAAEKDIDERFWDDKLTLTWEEVGVKKDLEEFLDKLKCPFKDQLNEALLVYKIQLNPLLKIKNSENIFEFTLKAMILALQLDQPEVFVQLITYFEAKSVEIRTYRYEIVSKLFDFVILALFKEKTSIHAFALVLNYFLDFLCSQKKNRVEEEMKRFLEISGKEPKDKQLIEKINIFIEIILDKISYFPTDPIDESGRSFVSIYFKYLLRTGKSKEALNFLIDLPIIFLRGSKLSIEDSFFMLLAATEYNSVEMFKEILTVVNPDFSLVLSSQLILNRMKKFLIQYIPKIFEIQLSPDKFILKPNSIAVVLEILMTKSSFEEIVAYFISKRLFTQLELILSVQRNMINYEQFAVYLKSTLLLTDADYMKLIFTSLPFTNFYFFISEVLKHSLTNEELNCLIFKTLLELPGTLLTSWAVDSIVSLSSGGPNHLLNLALKSSANDVIELLCAFYKFESQAELLRDDEAAERRVVFINVDGYEFVQIFDQFNNSFEIFIP